jgi:hypothetical protein
MTGRLSPVQRKLHTPAASWVCQWQQNDISKRFAIVGPNVQVLLLKKALDVRFDYQTPISRTIADLRELHQRIVSMGKLDDEKLLTVLLLNSLGDRFGHLQSAMETCSHYPDSAPNLS